MSNRVISRRQWIALQSMSLPIMGHFLLIEPMLKIAGRDAWLSALISIPAGIAFAAVLIALRQRWRGTPLIDSTYQVAGPVGGFLISLVFAVYFFFLAVITLRGLEQFMATVFLPETPYWAIGGSFLLLVAWSMHRNIEAVARIAVILLVTILMTGHTVGLNLLQEKQYSRLLPLMVEGWGPVLAGSILLVSTWSEMIAVLMFRSRHYSPKEEGKGYLVIILFNTLLAVLTLSSVVAVFGMPLATQVDWPVQVEVRLIKFGVFDRLDIYGLFVMTAGCYIRTTMFLFAASETVARMFSLSSYKPAILPLSGAALAVSLLRFWNNQVYKSILTTFYSYSWLFILLPLFLLMLTIIRQRRFRESSGGSEKIDIREN